MVDCNDQPVSNGYIWTKINNYYTRYTLANDGSYQFTTFICVSSVPGRFWGVDLATMKESAEFDTVITSGTLVNPAIKTCDQSTNVLEGSYRLSGIHNRPGYYFPYTNVQMKLIGFGPSQVAMFWVDAGSVGHPIATDSLGTLSWYGPTVAPVIKINPANNEISDVFNSDPAGPPIGFYNGAIPIHNYYDPVAKKVYVAWEYNNNVERAFFDTLTYTGP